MLKDQRAVAPPWRVRACSSVWACSRESYGAVAGSNATVYCLFASSEGHVPAETQIPRQGKIAGSCRKTIPCPNCCR